MITKRFHSIFNFKTKRKIIVFEVDDYGAIRMPSRKTYDKMINGGFELSGNRFNRYDSLSSVRDLNNLFEILCSVKDKNNHHAVFTPLTIVSNPDFEKIEENGFTQYFSEPFTQTLNKYFENNDVWNMWKEGIESGIFHPQFHGTEHLNTASWLRALRAKHPETLTAFKYGFYGLPPKYSRDGRGYMETYSYINRTERNQIIPNIENGLNLFRQLFGYSAMLFTPPNATFDLFLEGKLKQTSISFITRPKIRMVNRGNTKKLPIIGFLGRRGLMGLRYSTRTCAFEPNDITDNNGVSTCLANISKAFSNNEPAIISSHRVNFVGNIDKKNGDEGLKQLSELLKSIIKKWPDVEFMSSAQLYNLIINKSNES